MVNEEFEIGGMTYDSYDADGDSMGEIGHSLASQRVMMEGLFLPRKSSQREDRNDKYRRYIVRAEILGLSTNPFEDDRMKKSLLQEIWPGKFGSSGNQDISGLENARAIGELYSEMMKSARRALKREKR